MGGRFPIKDGVYQKYMLFGYGACDDGAIDCFLSAEAGQFLGAVATRYVQDVSAQTDRVIENISKYVILEKA